MDQEYAAAIAGDLRNLGHHLSAFLKGVSRVAEQGRAREQLLDAGVSEQAVGQAFMALRILLSDPSKSASGRLGLGRGCECSYCGRVPDPLDLVSGESVAVCVACALMFSSGAGEGESVGRRCDFCFATRETVSDLPIFVGDMPGPGICSSCVDLSLSIFMQQRSGS